MRMNEALQPVAETGARQGRGSPRPRQSLQPSKQELSHRPWGSRRGEQLSFLLKVWGELPEPLRLGYGSSQAP